MFGLMLTVQYNLGLKTPLHSEYSFTFIDNPFPRVIYTFIPNTQALINSQQRSDSDDMKEKKRKKRKKMESSIYAVERILNYSFKNKKLVEEALTHPSCNESANYERLEFIGDSALGLAFSKYLFLSNPKLDQGQLTLLRAANISTEKFARVAIKHDLYGFLRKNATGLDEKVREFSDCVSEEDDDAVAHGGIMKAPKVLADIVESVAAAVYVDVNFDLEKLWMIIRHLLEPIVTHEDLQQQPQPVTMLYELCQKQGKEVDIIYWKNETKNVADVYIDGDFVASCSSEQRDIAKLNAAKVALDKLSHLLSSNVGHFDDVLGSISGPFEIEGAKQKLHDLCGKRKWPGPTYKIENEIGPPHEKKYICSVQIATEDEKVLYMKGDEKVRLKEAHNSAASNMIRALHKLNSV